MVLIYEEFRKGRYRVLNLGRKNPSTSTSWDNGKAAWQENTRGFGIWTKLNVSHQPVLVARAANWALSWAAGGSVSSRLREGILPLHSHIQQQCQALLHWGPGSVRWG